MSIEHIQNKSVIGSMPRLRVLLWLGKDNWEESFKYFQKSAEEGFEPAYGQLGTIYYLEKLDIDEAEKWFEKADKAGCLDSPQAH